MALLFSTTGTQSPVVINDLGGLSLTHPTVDRDLELEYTRGELLGSADLATAMDAGELTAKGDEGETLTTSAQLVALSVDHDLLSHTDFGGAAPADGQAIVWNSSLGQAEWRPPPATIDPKLTQLGGLLDYTNAARFSGNDDIQYVQVFLQRGDEITHLETYQVQGIATATYRMGIYDTADPLDISLGPRNKVAETGLQTALLGLDGSFVRVAMSPSSYTIPTTGHYWLALTCSSFLVEFQSTEVYPQNYAPRREQAGGAPGSALPATAGTVSNPSGPVALVSAVRA